MSSANSIVPSPGISHVDPATLRRAADAAAAEIQARFFDYLTYCPADAADRQANLSEIILRNLRK